MDTIHSGIEATEDAIGTTLGTSLLSEIEAAEIATDLGNAFLIPYDERNECTPSCCSPLTN
jgi:hypothetical protein